MNTASISIIPHGTFPESCLKKIVSARREAL
jgi:hypothetical protein